MEGRTVHDSHRSNSLPLKLVAAGRTRQEMAQVLHFTPQLQVDAGFTTLMELLNSTGDGNAHTLCTANRLWGARHFLFEEPFLKLTRQQYHASLTTLDFGRTEEARGND